MADVGVAPLTVNEGVAPLTVGEDVVGLTVGPAPFLPVRVPYEPVASKGLIPARHSPFATVPEADADPEDLAIGPPLDVPVEALDLARAPGELREGPWSLLLQTALGSAAKGTAPLVEDAMLRRSDAALSDDELTRLRPLADQVALLELEYLAASRKYTEAEDATPDPGKWQNPQHLLEAMKVHERRMVRLQQGMRDAHERLTVAVETLRVARGGLGSGGATPRAAVGVEVTHHGTGTSRVRAVTR